ncbi:MAG: arginine--tRNA ligase [Candidatus Krumholzibacteriia bacterium]
MSFRKDIQERLEEAVSKAGYGGEGVRVVLEKPRHKEHGDMATPVALSLAREFKKNPMQIAEEVAGELSFPAGTVAAVEVARPGYINLTLSQEMLTGNLEEVHRTGDRYGESDCGRGTKCQVEYVSANPTGPLVLVSARAAAIGSVIVNLLRAAGFDAEGEYYVNDSGNQVRALGESLRFRVRERLGRKEGGEIGAYPGDYLKDIAATVEPDEAARWDADPAGVARYGAFATDALLREIERDLERFGVRFDNFFRESSLHPDAVDEARGIVEKQGYAYVEDGALYFRTSEFGDEKDRVLVKSDGNATYFLGDIAYHLTKLRRGHRWALDLLGPDHHGHIPRMLAAAKVLGAAEGWLNVLIVGWVRLLEGGKPVSMSKRAGDIITMRELIEDVGKDVAKFFFLMRRANTPLDFDLDLARKQSDENPVYYVQYAHARIASVARFAEQKGLKLPERVEDCHKLESPQERELMVHLLFFPHVVEAAALTREPHRVATYAQELAALFHRFYHAHRVVTDSEEVSAGRFFLVDAARQVLRNALCVMGVDAPESM